jgi:hypothetical protein
MCDLCLSFCLLQEGRGDPTAVCIIDASCGSTFCDVETPPERRGVRNWNNCRIHGRRHGSTTGLSTSIRVMPIAEARSPVFFLFLYFDLVFLLILLSLQPVFSSLYLLPPSQDKNLCCSRTCSIYQQPCPPSPISQSKTTIQPANNTSTTSSPTPSPVLPQQNA